MENGLNQHYATRLGLGEEWRVTNVDLNVLGRRIDIHLEYAKECAPCPECGTLRRVYDQQAERVWRHLDTMVHGLRRTAERSETAAGRDGHVGTL